MNKPRAQIKKSSGKYNYHLPKQGRYSVANSSFNSSAYNSHSLETEAHDPYFIQVRDGIIQEASSKIFKSKLLFVFPNKDFQFTDAQKYDGVIVARFLRKNSVNLAKIIPISVLN